MGCPRLVFMTSDIPTPRAAESRTKFGTEDYERIHRGSCRLRIEVSVIISTEMRDPKCNPVSANSSSNDKAHCTIRQLALCYLRVPCNSSRPLLAKVKLLGLTGNMGAGL